MVMTYWRMNGYFLNHSHFYDLVSEVEIFTPNTTENPLPSCLSSAGRLGGRPPWYHPYAGFGKTSGL